MKDRTLEDIRHLGEPVDDGLRAFADEAMPKHLWRMPKYGAARASLRCEACGALVEMDAMMGSRYAHGKRMPCPSCGVDVMGVDSWRGRAWLHQRMYTEWWRKSAVDPNVLVCVGVEVIRRYDAGETKTLFNPLAFVVFEYGHAGRRYEMNRYTSETVKRMKSVNDMSCRMHGGWLAACPDSQFMNACAGTPFARLDLPKLDGKAVRVCNMNFLAKHPCCEYLMRFGLSRLILEAWNPFSEYHASVNWRGKTAEKVLKVPKARVREISRAKVDLGHHGLEAIQKFEALGLNWPVERILPFQHHMTELSVRAQDYKLDFVEVLKYLDRQMRRNTGAKAGDLPDYWRQCVQLRMNMAEPETIFPRDLARMHQALTDRLRAIEEERRAEEAAKRKSDAERENGSKIAKVAKKLAAGYTFSAFGLMLRPAESAAEVIDEGTALHHCVGNYVRSYASGGTILCVLRRAEVPDAPFHTVEFSARDGSLVQCRGNKNQTTPEDKPLIDAFWQAFEAYRGSREKVRVSA